MHSLEVLFQEISAEKLTEMIYLGLKQPSKED